MVVNALTRIYTEQDLSMGSEFDLPANSSHYLTRVMRLKKGQNMRIFNTRDGEFLAELVQAKRFLCRVRIVERLRHQAPTSAFHLAFSIIKKPRVEWMMEKLTELGIAHITPIHSQYTQQYLPKLSRLNNIILEAAEQSERLDMPILHETCDLTDFLAAWPKDTPLIACIESGAEQAMAQALWDRRDRVNANAGLLIGPEGGFSPTEIEMLKQQDFIIPVHLGQRILKADTASIHALGLLQAIWGDANQPPPRHSTQPH